MIPQPTVVGFEEDAFPEQQPGYTMIACYTVIEV